MNTINVSSQSESALKAYAALQFPGSIDNFGTKTPIHMLMQQADSEHQLVLTDACDSDCDLDGAQFDYLGTTADGSYLVYDQTNERVKYVLNPIPLDDKFWDSCTASAKE